MIARRILLCLLWLWPLTAATAFAQPDDVSGVTIHVVQRDETLFEIAQRFGTTVDALTLINGLPNPDSLRVGQRLIIPGERHTGTGLLTTHIAQPGETLHTIALRYNSTLASLSEANNILHARRLYGGQSILVPEGANGTLPADTSSMHVVAEGENWLRVAMRYNLTSIQLAAANGLTTSQALLPGQHLLIPGDSSARRFVDLPAPMLDFQLGPLPVWQGKTLSAYIRTDGLADIQAQAFGRDIPFYTEDLGEYYAFWGVHAFIEPGLYPFRITFNRPDGTAVEYTSYIRVLDAGYGSEIISLPEERLPLLENDVVEPELDRITAAMSGVTEPRYFDALMNLPATGPVTSQFGTRRSYNGSAYSTFHSGADFGGAPGSLIMAPTAGTVVLAELLPIRGNTVIIDHGWGVYTGYWHNSELFVTAGQFVQRGDPISSLGNTGLSTGAHLHWEMWVGGVQVDPLQWLTHTFDDFSPATPEPDTVSFPQP